MARARNLKPGFFKNEVLAEVDPLGRILFEGLWCLADREGRLEDRPLRIKAEILPYDDCDIDNLLNTLAKKEFIKRYEVDGKCYIWITNFLKHQNPHKKEAASILPAPPCFGTSTNLSEKLLGKNPESTGNSGTSRADSLNPLTDSLNLDQQQQDRKSHLESNSANSEENSAAATDEWTKVDKVFTRLTGMPIPSPRDVEAMKHAVAMADGRTDLIIEVMEACYKNYKPTYPGAKIRSFKYFVPAIQEAVATMRARSPSEDKTLTDDEKAKIQQLTEELTELLPDEMKEVIDSG